MSARNKCMMKRVMHKMLPKSGYVFPCLDKEIFGYTALLEQFP